VLAGVSCKGNLMNGSSKEGPIVAEVGDKKLLKSEVANLIGSSTDAEDSIRIMKGLINNWVKDQLMIIEAEKSLPADINLNKMIEDYRASLLLYNYETRLAGELLDTVITQQQKEKYYNDNADEYVLSEPVAKYIMAKIPSKAKGLDDFYKDWKKGNSAPVTSFCKQNADYYDLNGHKWQSISELESILPKNFIARSLLDNEESIRKKDKDFEYFIKVNEYVDGNQNPPFDYIEAKIEKVLLNERKRDLIKQKKQQLFDKMASGSNVKIYVN
jgi:hypothetical protein